MCGRRGARRAGVPYSPTGCDGWAFPTNSPGVRTNRGALVLCSAPRRGRARASCRVSPLRAGVPYSPTGLSDRAFPTLRRDAAVGRCLLSNRMRRVSSSARIATSFDPSRRRRAVPVETCR